MENKMETTIVCWGCIGIMENTMESTIRCSLYFKRYGQSNLQPPMSLRVSGKDSEVRRA